MAESVKELKARIALDGEAQFKQAISASTTALKTLSTESKLTEEKFKGQANSLDALRAKHQVLAKTVDEHAKKEKAIADALKNAQNNYVKVGNGLKDLKTALSDATKRLEEMKQTASSDEIAKQEEEVKKLSEAVKLGEQNYTRAEKSIQVWQQRLNSAQAEGIKMNRELEQTADYMREAEQSADHCATSIDEFGKAAKDAAEGIDAAGESASMFGDVLSGNLASDLIGKAFDGVKSAAGAIVDDMKDLSSATADLSAQTGLTGTELERYRDVMLEIKGDNFGETYQDVAAAMAEVVQIMGEMDGDALKDVTESAMTMEDTFGIDMNESIRAVDVMTKTMGIDAEHAFDLMAKGAQVGLNRSDELADNITEYGQLWAQAGFSAEEMFSILENGLDAGAYNLDKVNDFVKEFGISLADGRMAENIESFSETTQGLFDAWQNGEATTADVFNSVIADLNNMSGSESDVLELASTMWSALGEDNAAGVITALGNVNTNFENVKGTMDGIKETKYSDLEDAVSGLGQAIQEKFLTPIADTAIPAITTAIETATEAINGLGGLFDQPKSDIDLFLEEVTKSREETEKLLEESQESLTQAEVDVSGLEAYKQTILTINSVEEKSEFQKYQLKSAVSALSGSIPELAAAFDEEQGKINLTNREISALIDNQEQLIKQKAVAEALEGAYTSLANAELGVAQSQSALDSAQAALDAFYTETGKSAEEWQQLLTQQYTLTGEAGADAAKGLMAFFGSPVEGLDKYQELTASVAAATDELNANKRTLDEAQRSTDQMSEAAKRLTGEYVAESEAYDENGILTDDAIQQQKRWSTEKHNGTQALDENTDAVQTNAAAAEELSEAEAAAAAAAADGAEAARAASEEMVTAYHDAVDEIKNDLQEKINPFEKFDTESGFGTDMTVEEMTANLQSQAEAFQTYEEKLNQVKEHVGKEIAPEFMQYIESMGIEGTNMLDHILITFEDQEPEKVKALSDAFMESMNLTDEIAKVNAANRVAYETSTGELGSTEFEFDGLRRSIASASQDAQGAWAQFDAATESALNEAVATAERLGIKIPDGLADGIKSGETSPQSAVEQLNGAIEGAWDGLIKMAQEAGIDVDDELEKGFDAGAPGAVTAYEDLVNKLIGKSEEMKKELGKEVSFDDLVNSIEQAKESMSGGWDGITDDMSSALSSAVDTAREMGAEIPLGLSEGIASGTTSPEEALAEISGAIQGKCDELTQAARDAGLEIPPSIAEGMASGDTSQMAAAYDNLIAYIQDNADTSTIDSIGEQIGESFNTSVQESADSESGRILVTTAEDGADDDTGMSTKGEEAGEAFATGMEGTTGAAAQAAGAVAQAAKNAMVSWEGSFNSIGVQMSMGLASGIRSGGSSAISAAASVASQSLAAAKSALGIHSPSKKFRDEVGAQISAGIAFGIKDKASLAGKEADKLSANVLSKATKWLSEYKKKHDVSLEDERYYWQQVVKHVKEGTKAYNDAVSKLNKVKFDGMNEKQSNTTQSKIDSRFGVSRTKTTGTGNNQKTETKDAEDYYGEIYSAAQKYLSNVQVLYDVSLQGQLAYWEEVKATLKKGTQAWYDAQKEINSLKDGIAEQAAKDQEDANRKLIDDAQTHIDHLDIQGKLTAEKEAKIWSDLLGQFKKGSDEWWEVKENLNDANDRIGGDLIDQTQRHLEHLETNGKLTAEKEAEAWQNVMDQLEKGSDEWYTAKANLKDANDRINSDLLTKYENYVSKQQTLGNMDTEQELAFWQKRLDNFKKGSDEYLRILDRINTLEDQKYSEKLSDYQKYVDKETTLGRMGTETELEYWKQHINDFKEYSDEWLQVYQRIVDLEKQKQQEHEDNLNQMVSDAQDFLRKREILNGEDLEYDLAYWLEVQSHLEYGSDAWYDAQETINGIRENLANNTKETTEDLADSAEDLAQRTARVQQSILSKYKTYNKLSLRAEMDYWDIARQQFQAGTDERIEADQAYFDAREAYYDKLNELDENYASEKKRVDDELEKSVEDLQKTYEDSVKSREDEIKSGMNLFEDWDAEGWDPDTLLKNLDHQVQGLEFWRKQLDDLKKKGLSKGLMDELEAMGPEAAANLWSLNQMTAEQLDEYQAMWQEKSDMAHEQAVQDNEDLWRETQQGIADARRTAQNELAGIEEDYRAEIASLNTGLSDGLRSLVEQSGQIGEDMVAQLVEAVRQGVTDVANEIARLNAEAEKAKQNAKQEAGVGGSNTGNIQPSQKAQEQARKDYEKNNPPKQEPKPEPQNNPPQNNQPADTDTKQLEDTLDQANDVLQELEEEAEKVEEQQRIETDSKGGKGGTSERDAIMAVIRQGTKRSKTLTPDEISRHSTLWQRIVKNYGYSITEKQMRKLAEILNIPISANMTDEEKKKVRAAMARKGYKGGTRRINSDELAWLLEGGQTEYVYRQSDKAILQPMGTGDKVINAEGADRLYSFASDPEAFLRTYAAGMSAVNTLAARDVTQSPVVNVNNAGIADAMDDLSNRMEQIAQRMESLEVVLDTGKVVGELQAPLSRANAAVLNRRTRGGLR